MNNENIHSLIGYEWIYAAPALISSTGLGVVLSGSVPGLASLPALSLSVGLILCSRLATGLTAIARGPQSARASLQTMLRKVILEHGPHRYEVTIRHISVSGAMIEGLWDASTNTVFDLQFSPDYSVKVTTRWSKEKRMGSSSRNPRRLTGAVACC